MDREPDAPNVSNDSPASDGKPARAKRKSRKPPPILEHHVPRLDTYSVNFCPYCGLHIEGLRKEYLRMYDEWNLPVVMPSNVCVNCGLERDEMAIHLTSKRQPTMKTSNFKRRVRRHKNQPTARRL